MPTASETVFNHNPQPVGCEAQPGRFRNSVKYIIHKLRSKRFYYLYFMPQSYPIYNPEFYTATILEWKHLLKPDKYKDIIIETLRFLVTGERIRLFGFIIMSNHLHLIWQPLGEYLPKEIQHSFMTRTAQKIKSDLEKITHPY